MRSPSEPALNGSTAEPEPDGPQGGKGDDDGQYDGQAAARWLWDSSGAANGKCRPPTSENREGWIPLLTPVDRSAGETRFFGPEPAAKSWAGNEVRLTTMTVRRAGSVLGVRWSRIPALSGNGSKADSG